MTLTRVSLPMIAGLVALVAAFGFVAACGESKPPPEQGIVIEKDYDAARTETTPAKTSQRCTGTGSKRRCRTHTTPAKTTHHDADWDVTIRGENKDGDVVEEEVDVSQAEYDAIAEGDCVSLSGEVVNQERCS